MMSIRSCMLAAALTFAPAAPGQAGWWPGQGSVATAAAPGPAANRPRTGTAVPEPADFALFAAGVVGLLLGRRGSRSRRD